MTKARLFVAGRVGRLNCCRGSRQINSELSSDIVAS
jgi:hypothetical protein